MLARVAPRSNRQTDIPLLRDRYIRGEKESMKLNLLALLAMNTYLTEATAISKPTGPPPSTARRMFEFKSLQPAGSMFVCLLMRMTVQHSHVIHVVFDKGQAWFIHMVMF